MIDYECSTSTINASLCQKSYITSSYLISLFLFHSLHTNTDSPLLHINTLMSTLNHLFDLPEQICYVQCGFCNTILMVIMSLLIALLKFIIFGLIFNLFFICFHFICVMQVSVPCSSLTMVVTVRCGHCTSLLSVNMMKASFVPFHLLASLTHLEVIS